MVLTCTMICWLTQMKINSIFICVFSALRVWTLQYIFSTAQIWTTDRGYTQYEAWFSRPADLSNNIFNCRWWETEILLSCFWGFFLCGSWWEQRRKHEKHFTKHIRNKRENTTFQKTQWQKRKDYNITETQPHSTCLLFVALFTTPDRQSLTNKKIGNRLWPKRTTNYFNNIRCLFEEPRSW